MDELLPCQKIHYLHCCKGGAMDGAQVPSEHWYESLEMNGIIYIRDGDPVPFDDLDEEHDWEAVNCTDEHIEALWYKAPMKLLV